MVRLPSYLTDKASASNENLCTFTRDLFRTAMVECSTANHQNSSPEARSKSEAEGTTNDVAQKVLLGSSFNSEAEELASDSKAHQEMLDPSPDTAVDLFIGGVDANDIRQGATLQDCWLLSALSILAGESEDGNTFIEDLFVRQTVNGQPYKVRQNPMANHLRVRLSHSQVLSG